MARARLCVGPVIVGMFVGVEEEYRSEVRQCDRDFGRGGA